MRLGQPLPLIGAAARLLPVFACALIVAGCEIVLGSPPSMFDDERAVARALSAIESRYRGPVRVLQIAMADSGMLLRRKTRTIPTRLPNGG